MRDSVKSARLLTLLVIENLLRNFNGFRNLVKKIRCDESGR